MANTFDDRKKARQGQYEQEWGKHVAEGIRKKFADQFDFGGMSDQDVIQRHHARFGAEMDETDYVKKLNETYAGDFKSSADQADEAATKQVTEPKESLIGTVKKSVPGVAAGLLPFVAAETPKAIKAIASKTPIIGQAGLFAGEAAAGAIHSQGAKQLEQTAQNLPALDPEAKANEFFQKLQPGLAAKGYTDDQIMAEARHRANHLALERELTAQSIGQDAQAENTDALLTPANAAANALFFGLGEKQIAGFLTKNLEKVGLKAAAPPVMQTPLAQLPPVKLTTNVLRHAAQGALVGVPGMAAQGAISQALVDQANTLDHTELAKRVVSSASKGALHGATEGAVGGAIVGGGLGLAAEAVKPLTGAIERNQVKKEYRASVAEQEADAARLRGWQDFNTKADADAKKRGVAEADAAKTRVKELDALGSSFDPYAAKVPPGVNPAEFATSYIQELHGDDAAMSEAGLRAASRVEARIKLFNDANAPSEQNTLDLADQHNKEVRFAQSVQGLAQQTGMDPAQLEALARSPVPSIQDLATIQTRYGVTSQMLDGLREMVPPESSPAPPLPQEGVEPSTEAALPAPEAATPEPSVPTVRESVLTPPEKPVSTKAEAALKFLNRNEHLSVDVEPSGEGIFIKRLGLETGESAKPGRIGKSLEQVIKVADAHGLSVRTVIMPPPGPRGGRIPLEKVLPWYESHGFTVVGTTKIPEGALATAELFRKPKRSMSQAKEVLMSRAKKGGKAA